MAAANTDKLRKAAPNFSTTIGTGGCDDTTQTIPLNSVSGLPTGTAVEVTINATDANGNATPSLKETVIGVVSGSNLVNCLRGRDGTTGKAHGAGSTVVGYFTADAWNDIIDAILAEHSQAGAHTVDTISEKTPAAGVTVDGVKLKDSQPYCDVINEKTTAAGVTVDGMLIKDGQIVDWDGWCNYAAVVPTLTTSDDPTYVITFAGVDLTSKIEVGNRVKWTQNSIVRYGIVTAIAFSTDTTLTILTRCDGVSANYDVLNTGTYAISAFAYSKTKAPKGFPLDPTKWEVLVTDSTVRAVTAAASTWYNVGTTNAQITIPIGVWEVSYEVHIDIAASSGAPTFLAIRTTLSTANNSQSDEDLTSIDFNNYVSGLNAEYVRKMSRSKTLTLAAKTLYYLNTMREASGGTINITNFNVDSVGNYKMKLRARCAYL